MKTSIPELPRHCGSWIIRRDGKAIAEVFNRRNAEKAAKAGYEVVTALDHLVSLNRQA
jgi:hypothetical protein